MDLGHTCLFQKGFCKVHFLGKEKDAVTFTRSVQLEHEFLGEIKQMPISKKISPINKSALGLLYHRLGNRSTRSLMARYTEMFWKDIVSRIDPYPICT